MAEEEEYIGSQITDEEYKKFYDPGLDYRIDDCFYRTATVLFNLSKIVEARHMTKEQGIYMASTICGTPRTQAFQAACRKFFTSNITNDERSDQSLDIAFKFGVNPMIEQVEQMKRLVIVESLPIESAVSDIASIIDAKQTPLFKWRAKEYLKSRDKFSTRKAQDLVQTFASKLKRGISV